MLEQGFDVLVFGLLGAQEFLARRYVVKQFQHFHPGTLGQARPALRRRRHAPAGARHDSAPSLRDARVRRETPRRCSAGLHREIRANRCFPGLRDCRSCWWRARQRHCCNCSLLDAATVIADANHARAAGLDFHGDRSGTRIEAVFHQFLDHRSRPFDHFAGGDLVDQVRRQGLNLRHGID